MINLYPTRNTGRVVYRWKNFVKHTGVLAGHDDYYNDMVIHNHPSTGYATIVTMKEFANGKEVFFSPEKCIFPQRTVWKRAKQAVRNRVPYDPFTSNCQHLTSNACSGKNQSEDLMFFGGLALFAVLLGGIAGSGK